MSDENKITPKPVDEPTNSSLAHKQAPLTGSDELQRNQVRNDREVEAQMSRMSRRSFAWGALGAAAAIGGWKWIANQETLNGVPWLLRRGLQADEVVAGNLFRSYRIAPTFRRELATMPRANGEEGLSTDLDPDTWKLLVFGMDGPEQTGRSASSSTASNAVSEQLSGGHRRRRSEIWSTKSPESDVRKPEPGHMFSLTMQHILDLPRFEMVTELKCIEGWSNVVAWAGARFADFAVKYPPVKIKDDSAQGGYRLPKYVSMETPDGEYYVGLDIESAMHPQTLLCYEMNGQPLEPEHGAPLRLVIPVKYGIKHIKRIGVIRFTDNRPEDYWAQQGYDWYAGH